MRSALVGVLLLLAVAGALAAGPAPQVFTPVNGAKVGPSVDVAGQTEGRQFVVIITDVYVKGEAKSPWQSVPGLRHWTEDDGSFAFRIATPRLWKTPFANDRITYKIRVFTQRPDEEPSDTTTVTCTPE